MPQVHKGERVVVTARIPQRYHRKLDQVVHTTGVSKSDFITELITTALDDIDVENLDPQQDRLKIPA